MLSKVPMRRNDPGIWPSQAALALATKITPAIFADVYIFAVVIDEAWEGAAMRIREEERQRLFRMGFWDVLREYWAGRKLRRAE